MFDDLDLDDVEASGKSKAADLDFEQGSDSGDGNFNANELLNLSEYQNKRKKEIEKKEATKPGPATNLNVKDVFDPHKLDEMNKDEDDWGMSDDWGDSKALKEVKLDKHELQSKNLNKLDNEELAAYKRAMDKEFMAKQLKPGDPGFVYDKVVDFSKNRADGPLEDDSWGEDDGIEEQDQQEYYDEEDEEGIQDALDKYTDKQMQDQIQKSRKSNMTGDDEDYFDDDFDDDFA